MPIRPKKLSEETLRQALEQLLENEIEIPEIDLQNLFRPHDDNGGELGEGLQVIMFQDGDICIHTNSSNMTRFRSVGGGTASPRTHNALRILMLAILRDNKFSTRPT
ncbi:MAG: hypothetical protein RL292_116 [Candidatus Parcubacteria bacterium]|jgi:hypothetical protein